MTEPELHPEHEEALLLRDALIGGLAGAASHLSDVGEKLYRASVLSKGQRIALFAILALVLFSTSGVLVIALQNKHGNSLVRDCVLPKGMCYKRNAANTAKLIAELEARNEAASWCANVTVDPAGYRACVTRYLRVHPVAAG